ncbi:MAG: radical SAM protein [Deltaproteobacteria bacterium]|nr:radical SAM protein [Deltaproteobacteria bacterium]
MRAAIRRKYFSNAPKLLWNILARGKYDFRYDLMPIHVSGMSLKKRVNLLLSGLNLVYRHTRPWSWPIHSLVELTNYCNISCHVCPTGQDLLRRKPANIDMGMLARIMDEMGPYLLTVSLWAWGESLLHPEFPEAVRILRQHGVVPILSTNGQNLTDERVLEGLLKEPPAYLIVAIDGLTQKTHAAFRTGADLKTCLAGVERLAELKRRRGLKKPVLHMRMIATKANQYEIGDAKAFAEKHGFDMLSLRTLSMKEAMSGPHSELLPELEELRAYKYINNRMVKRNDFVCQNVFAFPAVYLDGTIPICEQDYNAEVTCGRFGNGVSFADIWFGRKARKIRKIVKHNMETFAACRECPFVDRLSSTCSVSMFDFRDGGKRVDAEIFD